jgi:hypothetical protein
MRLTLGAVACALVAALAGCGGGPGHGELGFEAAQSAGPAPQTRIVGALPAEARVLRAILDELGPTRISRIGIKPINRLRLGGRPPGSVMLTVSAGMSLRGAWESYLVAGRYAAEAWRLHLRKPGRLHQGDGTTGARPIAVSRVRVDLAAARTVLRRADARLVEVRRPFGALVVTVRASDPAAFLKYRAERFLRAFGSRPSTYWAVEDASGAVVYAGGTLTSGVGMHAARGDLESCGPIHSLGMFGAKPPPPCPA